MNATTINLQYVFQGKFIIIRVVDVEGHYILVNISILQILAIRVIINVTKQLKGNQE